MASLYTAYEKAERPARDGGTRTVYFRVSEPVEDKDTLDLAGRPVNRCAELRAQVAAGRFTYRGCVFGGEMVVEPWPHPTHTGRTSDTAEV